MPKAITSLADFLLEKHACFVVNFWPLSMQREAPFFAQVTVVRFRTHVSSGSGTL